MRFQHLIFLVFAMALMVLMGCASTSKTLRSGYKGESTITCDEETGEVTTKATGMPGVLTIVVGSYTPGVEHAKRLCIAEIRARGRVNVDNAKANAINASTAAFGKVTVTEKFDEASGQMVSRTTERVPGDLDAAVIEAAADYAATVSSPDSNTYGESSRGDNYRRRGTSALSKLRRKRARRH